MEPEKLAKFTETKEEPMEPIPTIVYPLEIETAQEVDTDELKKKKPCCRSYCKCFGCLGFTLILLAVCIPLLVFRQPQVEVGKLKSIALNMSPLGAQLGFDVTLKNPNFYPIVFSHTNLHIFNYKDADFGTVTKDETIKVPARGSRVIRFDAVIDPNLKEIIDVAKDCQKNKEQTTVKVDGSVQAEIASILSFKVHVGPRTENVQCLTPELVINQLLGPSTGKPATEVVGVTEGLIDGINSITNSIRGAIKKPPSKASP